MKLSKVELDEKTWGEASETRRHEYVAAMRELTETDMLSFDPQTESLRVNLSGQGCRLCLLDAADARLAMVDIPWSALKKHITEYVDIVRQMEQADQGLGFGAARLEALDMAKKLAHDDAGKTLQGLCEALSADHGTSRRLFTLLLTLKVDTTQLVGVRGHRPVR